jgi:anti-sigma factor RsiW
MKDSEFIELLNLYLDHEIGAADAARLEAEVQNNPSRRRVYQEYCRMQKACKLLAQDFADESQAAPEQKVIAFEQARSTARARSSVRYVSAGLMAAAACVAVVLVGRRQTATPVDVPAAPIAQTTAPASAPTQTVAAAPIPAPAQRPANALSIRNRERAESLMLTSAQNDPHFAWMQDMRLAPLQTAPSTEPLHLENASMRLENRTFSSGKQPVPSDVELTAIRFQR